MYIYTSITSSLATVADGIFLPIPLSPKLFQPYFTVTNL